MRFVYSFALLILAVIAPSLFSQVRLFLQFQKNTPSSLVRRRLPYRFEIKLADQLKNCEDHVLDELSGYAILSCDFSRDKWNSVMGVINNHDTTEGGIFLYDYNNRNSLNNKLVHVQLMDYPLAGKDFHPLGLAYHAPSNKLFVVSNSRAGNRIEVFKLYPEEGVATHIRTIRDPNLPAPNAFHIINENELYVSNDHYFPYRQNALMSRIEVLLALPIGAITHVDLTEPKVKVTTVARQPFPNGIAKINETAYAVSSSSTASLRIYHVDPNDNTKWSQRERVDMPMHVDNLSVDNEGVVWVAGHPHFFSLDKVAKTRLECNSPEGKDSEKCKNMSSPSAVVSWTQEGGIKELYFDDEYWSSTTATRDVSAKMGLISGLYSKGILVWYE